MSINFSDFAATLQAAQTAIDNAPRLEAMAAAAERRMNEAQEHSQVLELRIQDYKAREETLVASLREAEAARDTFRQSASDVASQRDRLVQAFEAAVGMVQDEVRQIVPQPEPQPEATHVIASGHDSSGDEADNASFPHTADPVLTPPEPAMPFNEPEPQKWNSWGTVTDAWMEWNRKRNASAPVLSDGKPATQSTTDYSGERKTYS